MDWIATLRSEGIRSLSEFSDVQQVDLARLTGLSMPEMRRQWEARASGRVSTRQQTRSLNSGMSLDLETGQYRSIPMPGGSRKPSLSDDLLVRAQANQALRNESPATVRVIVEISQRMGFDGSKDPVKAWEYIQLHIEQLERAANKKPKRSKKAKGYERMTAERRADAEDEAWRAAKLYRAMLREAQGEDNEAKLRRALAAKSVKRQIAGTRNQGS